MSRLFMTVVTGCALASHAAAQSAALPGTWIRGGTAAGRAVSTASSGSAAFTIGTMGSGWGDTLVFAARGAALALDYPFFSAYDGMAPLHLDFDPAHEVENTLRIGPGVTRLMTRTEWRGDTLVITTRQPVPAEVAPAGTMAEVRRRLVVTAPDSLLVLTTRVGVAGAATNDVRTIYTRRH